MTSAFTIAFWMKTTTDNGLNGTAWFQGAGLVDGELPGDTTDWGLSQMGTRVAFGVGASDRTIFSITNVNTGAWIHVAATWDTLGAMHLYLNGSLEATDGLAGMGLRNTVNPFFIGRDLGGNAYTGSLDEIQIYGSVLTGGQIAALAAVPEPATYALMLAGLGTCLAVAWRRQTLGCVMLRRRRVVGQFGLSFGGNCLSVGVYPRQAEVGCRA